MGRHRIHVSPLHHGYRGGPGRDDRYYCEWAVVVGDRIRRLRRARDLTLYRLCHLVHKPEGGHYSPGHLSRLERGWASAPLYVYLAIADVLDVEPGRLLGSDDAQKPITEGEMTLVRFLRRMQIKPDEAIADLAARARPATGSSGEDWDEVGEGRVANDEVWKARALEGPAWDSA